MHSSNRTILIGMIGNLAKSKSVSRSILIDVLLIITGGLLGYIIRKW